MASLNFWDVAPKPSFATFIRGLLFGPSAADVAVPPRRLEPSQGGLKGTSTGAPPPDLHAAEPVTAETVHEYCLFLATNFCRNGSGAAGTQKPQYLPDLSATLAEIEAGILRPLVVRDASAAIVGCIASASIGRLRRNGDQNATTFKLRMIKDFCIAPAWRGRAHLGAYLLHAVWHDLRPLGEDAVTFMKEGAALGQAGPAIWSSAWVYRRMREAEDVSKVRRVTWTQLPSLLKIYTAGRTDYLFNILERKPRHSVAVEYTTFRGAILASFTRAYQRHPADGEWLCYQTGWLEKGEMLDSEREDGAKQLSAAAAAILGCYWVWADKRAAGSAGVWKEDGPYHWYAFHWTPGFYENAALWLVT